MTKTEPIVWRRLDEEPERKGQSRHVLVTINRKVYVALMEDGKFWSLTRPFYKGLLGCTIDKTGEVETWAELPMVIEEEK